MSVVNISKNSFPFLNKSDTEKEEEFNALPEKNTQYLETSRFTVGSMNENKLRNRYLNILPYDSNRVILPDRDNGYINASECLQKSVIISQGPKEEDDDRDSHVDFYHMIWTKGSTAVAMLTDYEEQIDATTVRKKCSRYLPYDDYKGANEYAIYSEIDNSDVKTAELRALGIKITNLKIKCGDQTRMVKHYHYMDWKDEKGGNTKIVAALAKQMLKENMPIIHCSAGIGRSGVLAAVIGAWKKIMQSETSSTLVFDVAKSLRSERHGAIQTFVQYQTLYGALEILCESELKMSETAEQSTQSLKALQGEVEALKTSKMEVKE